jgi:hypothetical protein
MFLELKEEFRIHTALEEQHIHLLLSDRIPEGAQDLEEELAILQRLASYFLRYFTS